MLRWNNPLFLIPLIIGLTYLMAGVLLWRFPPKKVNSIYGYRTPRSMKSKKNWDFAQQYAAVKLMRWGFFLALLGLPGLLIRMDYKTAIVVSLIPAIVVIIFPILRTERKLKSMDKEENP